MRSPAGTAAWQAGYTKLEQGRGGRPSEDVLDALAGALALDRASRDHLFRLAATARRAAPAGPPTTEAPVRPAAAALLDAVSTPAVLYGCRLDVLAMNAAATALYRGLDGWSDGAANCARTTFLDPAARRWYLDWAEVARDVVALLRRSVGEHPHDAGLRALVGELSAASAEFRALWATHEIRQDMHGRKRIGHPELGELTLEFEHLVLPDDGVILTVFTAPAGSPTQVALDRLAS